MHVGFRVIEGVNAQTLGTSGLGIKTLKPYRAFKGLRSGDLNLGLGIQTSSSLKPYRAPFGLGFSGFIYPIGVSPIGFTRYEGLKV